MIVRTVHTESTDVAHLFYEPTSHEVRWVNDNRQVLPQNVQEQLYREFNPNLERILNKINSLYSCSDSAFSINEFSDVLGLEYHRVQKHLSPVRVLKKQYEKIPVKNAMKIILKLMPLIERWQTVRQVAQETGIPADSIRNDHVFSKIDSVKLNRVSYISPVGKKQLLNLMTRGLYGQHPHREGLLSVKAVAKQLGMCRSAVWHHCKEKNIHAKRYGSHWYMNQEDVEVLQQFRIPSEHEVVVEGTRFFDLVSIAEQRAKLKRWDDKEGKGREYSRIHSFVQKNRLPCINRGKRTYVSGVLKDLLVEAVNTKEAAILFDTDMQTIRDLIHSALRIN